MQTNDQPRYRLLGGPGSPYSLKMRAVLRYRRLPHNWIVPQGYINEGGELATSGKKIIPIVQPPEGGIYWADSTPMILELERRHPGQRSVLPDDPAQRFLARLIEDFADELFVLVLFDFRWDKEVDQAFCARRQMAGWLGAMPTAQFDEIIEKFRARQTILLAALGDRTVNRPLLHEIYAEVLEAIEAQLKVNRFMFGERPSIADFGLYGQLSQNAIDPTPSKIMRDTAVRTWQWVQDMDDASGIEGNWLDSGSPQGPGVQKLMTLIGEVYLPYMVACARAAAEGARTVSVTLRGQPFVTRAGLYKPRCLGALKLALAEALAEGAPGLEAVLRQYNCWDALQLAPGEAETIYAPRHDVTEAQSGPF